MKRLFIFVLLLILMTGCSRIDNTEDYVSIVNEISAYDNKELNTATMGYKYYLPMGVRINKDLEFNQEFSVLNTKMYLYVDVVSYYYKNFTNNKAGVEFNYYYEPISGNGNFGYIGINEEEDGYFVEIVYNYARIEAYTNKSSLSSIVSYASLILDSIEYNDKLIETFINENDISSNDTVYNIKKPNDTESKFSQYLQEYVQEEDQITILPEE